MRRAKSVSAVRGARASRVTTGQAGARRGKRKERSRGAGTFEKQPKRGAGVRTDSRGQVAQAGARAGGGAKKAADGIAGAPKRAAKNVPARRASAGIAIGDVGAAGNIILLTIGLSLLASGLAGAFALYWLSKRPFSRWRPG